MNKAQYRWSVPTTADSTYTDNGLDQYTTITGVSPGPLYDNHGNLGRLGSATYSYDYLDRMVASNASGGVSFNYDPSNRLYEIDPTPPATPSTLFRYAGSQPIAEYNGLGAVTARYIPGPGGTPLAWYIGAGTTQRRWALTDERGSTMAWTDAAGAVANINTYGEYGQPGAGNVGRFQFAQTM